MKLVADWDLSEVDSPIGWLHWWFFCFIRKISNDSVSFTMKIYTLLSSILIFPIVERFDREEITPTILNQVPSLIQVYDLDNE